MKAKETEETITEEKKPENQTFDPEAFRTSLLEEVEKRNGGMIKEMKKELAKAVGAASKKEPVEADTEEEKPNPNLSPEINAELRKMKSLRAELDEVKKQAESDRTAKLESERKSAIRDAMSGITFRDKASADMFYKAISGDIVRDDDGELVAKTDSGALPMKDYIQDTAEAMPGLLAPKGMGGTGAGPTKATKTGGIDLDSIKPGLGRQALFDILKTAQNMTPTQ